jgi:subtilisin family serine protease
MKSRENYLDFINYCTSNKINIKREYDEFDLIIVEIPNKENINDFKNKIDLLSFVETSELDLITEASYTYEFTYNHPYHWYLQNIKSREAWDLMNQLPDNEPVEVAIIDTRVDVGHPELIGKISDYSINVLSIYDSEISPSDYDVDFNAIINCYGIYTGLQELLFNSASFHGTGVAGLVAAKNSNNDMMLSAGNDKVKVQVITSTNLTCPYSIVGSFLLIESLYAAFNNPKCVAISSQNIISYYTVNGLVGEVITYVTENGRNGKGIPFFNSTGNDTLNYPNSTIGINIHPGVYGIGASNALDNKAGFSQYGLGLFMCAPGENIMSLSVRGRWGDSLPLPNINPVIASRKWKDMVNTHRNLLIANGTSSSTPIVATVAATMMYVNPNLTKTQVINILAETARKTPGTEGYVFDENGYNNELGYGIVDHEAAVQEAIDLLPTEYDYSPNSEPISIQITNSPAQNELGQFIDITTTTTFLDTNLISGTEFLTITFNLQDSVNLDPQTAINLGTFTYTNITQTMINTNNILLPCDYPTGNKTISAQARIWDSIPNITSYGFAQDNTIIELTSCLESISFDVDINFVGIFESLFGNFSTTDTNGLMWTFAFENNTIFTIHSITMELLVSGENVDNLPSIVELEFVSDDNFGSPPVTQPLEELVFNWKFNSGGNFGWFSQNLPLTFTLRVLNITYEASPLGYPGSLFVYEYPYPGPSSTLTITEWP